MYCVPLFQFDQDSILSSCFSRCQSKVFQNNTRGILFEKEHFWNVEPSNIQQSKVDVAFCLIWGCSLFFQISCLLGNAGASAQRLPEQLENWQWISFSGRNICSATVREQLRRRATQLRGVGRWLTAIKWGAAQSTEILCKIMYCHRFGSVHCNSKWSILCRILEQKDKGGETAQLHSYLFVSDVRYDESNQIGFKICLKLINQLRRRSANSYSSLSSLAWHRGVMAPIDPGQ